MESIEKIIAESISHSPIEMAGELAPTSISKSDSKINWAKVGVYILFISVASGLVYYVLKPKKETTSPTKNNE